VAAEDFLQDVQVRQSPFKARVFAQPAPSL